MSSSLGLSFLSLYFLDLVDYFLYYVMEVFSYYLSKYFLRSCFALFSFWTPMMQMLAHLILYQRSFRLSSFLFTLFSIFCSVVMISTTLSSRLLICSSTSVILLLVPSSVFFWRRKWQPTPVFLPGESQGQGSLVGCHLWGRTVSDTTEVT